MSTIHTQFVAIDFAVATNKELTGNQKSILMVIQAHLPNPILSIKRIMEQTGLCRNTVFAHLKIMEKKRVLKRVQRKGTSNFYRINPRILLPKIYRAAEKAHKLVLSRWVVPKTKTHLVPKTQNLTKSKELYIKTNEIFSFKDGSGFQKLAFNV